MQQRLKDRNLDHIPTQRLTSPAEACRHAAELLKQYPRLVLKPADSAGTDSVFVCTTPEEVKVRATCLFENNNQLNLKNEIIILQPFIEGEEMVVDTVSYGGHHKICAIWKMGKGRYNGFDSICEFTELTALDTAQPVRLQDYVFGCLDALEIAWGAAHSELFLTRSGWKLIETGARPHGAGFPALSSLALKRTQIDELVLSICATDRFLAAIKEPYQPVSHLKIKELISSVSGRVKSLRYIDTVVSLPSYKKSMMPKVGQKITRTIDVYSSPGWIALSHPSADQLNRDYQRIVDIEKKGMFELYDE